MKLLVVVLCLLSERYLMHAVSYTRFSWFADYAQKVVLLLEKKKAITNPWLVLAAVIVPIILCVTIVYLIVYGAFFGFGGFIASMILFIYCLGPQNVFYPLSDPDLQHDANALAGNYFASANSQLFSVIFWFVILGPIAALTYRLIYLCRDISSISNQANQLTNLIEWLPARLTVMLYLLVGNFQSGFSSFMKFIKTKPDLNSSMLSECGLKAVTTKENEEVNLSIAESLVDHATIVLLVLIALCTLGAWL